MSDAREWRHVNTTCPQLARCNCRLTKQGATTLCNNVSQFKELGPDMARLQNVIVKKLTFDHVQISEIPAEWFSNHTILMLVVANSPLRDIGEAAFTGMGRLLRLLLEKDQLESLPSGLSAATRLRALQIRKNHIKFLTGVLRLPALIEFDLRFNGIETIEEKFLSASPELEHLLLSGNRIQHIPDRLFENTRKLKSVEIRDNRITAIGSFFDGLRYLETLDMSHNMIKDVEMLLKSKIPYLHIMNLEGSHLGVITELEPSYEEIEVLLLGDCGITEVKPGAFKALEKMMRLNLSNNSLSRLDGSVFSIDSKLEFLALSDNSLTSVTGTFNRTRRMKELKLSSNQIHDITDAFKGLTLLRKISMRSNLVTHIPDDAFIDNSELAEINLSENKIRWVGRNALKGLVTLNKLLLQGNQLVSLNGSIRNLPKIRYLDASFNAIQSLERAEFANNGRLTFIKLTANNISSLRGAFIGAGEMVSLILRKNQVQVLRRSDFPRRMPAKPTLTLDENPLMCDCRLAWLVRRDREVQINNYPTCEGPPWLRGKRLHDLTAIDLVRWEIDCQPGCKCRCNEDSFGERAISVNCSSAALNRTPEVFPKGTTRLDLNGNGLLQLDDGIANGAPHLAVLSLRNNLLSTLNSSYIPETVHSLDLRNNRLERFPHSLVLVRNLTSLWLSGNPFICECADYPFRQWIEAHGETVRDVHDVICAKSSNSLVSLKAFVNLGQKELCPAAVPKTIAYLLPVLVAVAMCLAVSAAYLRYRRELKVWLYARGCSLQCIKEDELDEEKLFDVFLSFSSKDAGWVHAQLLPGVEALGFSVCTYERNFKGGFLLHDIIRDAVACSRRTLLLLTQNFVESEWCRLEFRLAYQRALEDHINRLVIVLVDEVAPQAMDEDLRMYVRAANYLRWGEPSFWDKLLYSLPKKDASKKLITHKEPGFPMNPIAPTK